MLKSMRENTLNNITMRSGGEILVDQLLIHGVQHVFCVPGESYLAVLDAFHDRNIEVTTCRQEGGASMMAEAHGKITGRPGICFVTRGPGATNASPGIHIAAHDSTPLIVFAGQVAREMREREAFQEIDYKAVFGSIAKWAVEINDARRIPELISRAFHVATTGRPGPVIISLPEDMLTDRMRVEDALAYATAETSPGSEEIDRFKELVGAARRPFMILGGSRWSQDASDSFAAFAERFDIPVATTFRRAHLFNANHPCYAGDLGIGPNPTLLQAIRESDLVILVGGRLSEIPSQSYTLVDIPNPQMKFVHIHPGAEELGRVYRPTLAIHASPTGFAKSLSGVRPAKGSAASERAKAAHNSYLKWTEEPTPQPGAVNLGEIIVWLRNKLSADAFICNGAGNFAGWIHRFYRFRSIGTHVAPISGSMGYGVPAAIGAKRLYPKRTVVCVAGDGDFLMNGQEFATAVQYDLPIVFIVVDNGMYGTIRMHQENEYPERIVATKLVNPDFSAYANAFGGFGIRVEDTASFPVAFEKASDSGKPAIIHVVVDANAISPGKTLNRIRDEAIARIPTPQ